MYSAEQSMEQTSQHINQKLYNATQLLNTIMTDRDIYNLVADNYNGRDIAEQYEISIAIEKYMINIEENNEINHMCIYMPSDFRFINGYEVKNFEVLKEDNWYGEILDNKNGAVYVREPEGGTDYITIGRLFTDDYDLQRYIGGVKIYIDPDVFERIADNCVTTVDGACYIANTEGGLLAASDGMNEEYAVDAAQIQGRYFILSCVCDIKVNGKQDSQA